MQADLSLKNIKYSLTNLLHNIKVEIGCTNCTFFFSINPHSINWANTIPQHKTKSIEYIKEKHAIPT